MAKQLPGAPLVRIKPDELIIAIRRRSTDLAIALNNGTVAAMSTITVSLPDEDLAFLRAYSKKRGMSAEAVLARQTHSLREHLEHPLHPDVAAASGVIQSVRDGEQEHKDYLEKKHS